MNSVSEKILIDAGERAQMIADEGRAAVRELEERLAGEYEREAARVRAELDALYRSVYNRTMSMHSLDLRKRLLGEKRAIIDEAAGELAGELRKDVKTYHAFLERMVVKGAQTGREEIVVSTDDEGYFSTDVLERLNGQVSSLIGRASEITLSKENRETGGGLYLREGKREFNATMEAVVQVIAQRHELDIIKILFG